MRHRSGFTLIEVLIVIVIVGIVMAMASPKLTRTISQSGVQSANQQVAAYLAQARATAIGNGRRTAFVRNGGTIEVIVDNGSGAYTTMAARDVATEHGVTVTATRDTLKFDPRGFAIGNSTGAKIVVSKNGISDSVCVIGLGTISTRCTLAN